MFCNIQCDD